MGDLFPIRDGIRNATAKIGTDLDRVGSGRFTARRLSLEELRAMYYGNGFAAKVVDMPADDATRAWRQWEGSSNTQIDKIAEEERRLDLKGKTNTAKKLARASGASAILLGINDGLNAWEPANPVNTVGSLQFLQVLSRFEIAPGPLDWDPHNGNFGLPQWYSLVVPGAAPQNGFRVHHSRIVRFVGVPILEPSFNYDGWGGISILERLYDELRNCVTALGASSSLMLDAKTDVIQIPQLTNNSRNEEYVSKLRARFQMAAYQRSLNSWLLLDAEEKWSQRTVNFGGVEKILQKLIEVCAAVANMPLTRFLGTSPGGLGSTGAGELTDYYDHVAAGQDRDDRPRLEQIDRFLIPSATGGVKPRGLKFTFNALWQLSEQAKAEISLIKAQATQVYFATGLIPTPQLAELVQNQLDEDAVYPNVGDVMSRTPVKFELRGINAPPAPDGTGAAGGAPGSADGSKPRNPTINTHLLTDTTHLLDGPVDPSPLYVSRKVQNGKQISTWYERQGVAVNVSATDMHVTIAYSRDPVDWFAIGASYADKVVIPAGGPRVSQKIGNAYALLFASWELSWRNSEMREAGASWDHDDYTPHISLVYDPTVLPDQTVKPYTGPIILGPEIFEALELGIA